MAFPAEFYPDNIKTGIVVIVIAVRYRHWLPDQNPLLVTVYRRHGVCRLPFFLLFPQQKTR
jgi:type IV secretory pathway TrbD component